jgi:hypothetical protein
MAGVTAAVVTVAAAAYSYHQSQNTGINTGKINAEREMAVKAQQDQADAYQRYLDQQAAFAEEQRVMMEEQTRIQEEALAKSQAEKEEYEAKKQRRLALGASGRQSTILTGGAGLGSTAPVGRKTLLGA